MTKQIPLQQLKINTNRIELLNNMNIYSVRDLVLHFPYRYESIEETPLIDNEKVIIEGVLTVSYTHLSIIKMKIAVVMAVTGMNEILNQL